MKAFVFGILGIFLIGACSSTKIANQKSKDKNEAVSIANDTLGYEVTIIDIGFSTYLSTIAKPMSFYAVNYLENKNWHYITVWNERAQRGYKSELYENIINYDYNIHYGLEVNYKLYNYFKYVEYKYKERF